MNNKICISGYYGFENFGDEIILKILIEHLKKVITNPKITVFSSNPKFTSENLKVNSAYTFNLFDLIINIFKSDCLISGGGSLLQDITSKKSLIYYLFVIFTAIIFRKKILIFAQGIGPINNYFLRNITLFLLKKASYISVRDNKSFKFLSDNSIKNVQKCIDPVWNIPVEINKNTNKIGIQLRNFKFVTEEFIKKLAENINKYYSQKEIIILSLQNSIDLEVCEKLKSNLIKINPKINVKVNKNTSKEKVISDICSLDSFIAMRFHACLIAIKSGVKLLPINYDLKIETLSKEFGLDYINSISDMDDKFYNFASDKYSYDKNKISKMKFDFSSLDNTILN